MSWKLLKQKKCWRLQPQNINARLETIKAIAQAGLEMPARLLQGLRIQSVLITDGKIPLNLFGAANGMIGFPESQDE